MYDFQFFIVNKKIKKLPFIQEYKNLNEFYLEIMNAAYVNKFNSIIQSTKSPRVPRWTDSHQTVAQKQNNNIPVVTALANFGDNHSTKYSYTAQLPSSLLEQLQI